MYVNVAFFFVLCIGASGGVFGTEMDPVEAANDLVKYGKHLKEMSDME